MVALRFRDEEIGMRAYYVAVLTRVKAIGGALVRRAAARSDHWTRGGGGLGTRDSRIGD
jgi:hypothetical protein